MCLRDILLVYPDSAADSHTGLHAWHPPPFLANPDEVSLVVPWDTHTPQEVAAFLKAAYRPVPQPRKGRKTSNG